MKVPIIGFQIYLKSQEEGQAMWCIGDIKRYSGFRTNYVGGSNDTEMWNFKF
jgi:hypothetical protein